MPISLVGSIVDSTAPGFIGTKTWTLSVTGSNIVLIVGVGGIINQSYIGNARVNGVAMVEIQNVNWGVGIGQRMWKAQALAAGTLTISLDVTTGQTWQPAYLIAAFDGCDDLFPCLARSDVGNNMNNAATPRIWARNLGELVPPDSLIYQAWWPRVSASPYHVLSSAMTAQAGMSEAGRVVLTDPLSGQAGSLYAMHGTCGGDPTDDTLTPPGWQDNNLGQGQAGGATFVLRAAGAHFPSAVAEVGNQGGLIRGGPGNDYDPAYPGDAPGRIGDGNHHQVINQMWVQPLAPFNQGGALKVRSYSSYGYNQIVAMNDGTCWTWGEQEYGTLGLGFQGGDGQGNMLGPFVHQPTQVTGGGLGLKHVVQCVTGEYFDAVLCDDGTVYSWGADSGQMGLGDGHNSFNPYPSPGYDTPVLLPITGVAKLAATTSGLWCLKSDGTLWRAGQDQYGELAGGVVHSYMPAFTQYGTDADWADVSAAPYNISALKTSGTAWACGYNNSGTVGDGTYVDRYALVAMTMPGGVTGARICSWSNATYVLDQAGALWGTGYNYGWLGIGSVTPNVSHLTSIILPSGATVSYMPDGGGSANSLPLCINNRPYRVDYGQGQITTEGWGFNAVNLSAQAGSGTYVYVPIHPDKRLLLDDSTQWLYYESHTNHILRYEPVQGCVEVGAVVAGTLTSGGTRTLSVDAGAGSNRLLLAYVVTGGNNQPTHATYAGQRMDVYVDCAWGSGNGDIGNLFFLIDPPSGVNDLVVTDGDPSQHVSIVAVPFSNVHQETPIALVHRRAPNYTSADALTPGIDGVCPQQNACDYWLSHIQISQSAAVDHILTSTVVLDTSGGLTELASVHTSGGTAATSSADCWLSVAGKAGGSEPSATWTLDQASGGLCVQILVRSVKYALQVGWQCWGWGGGGETGMGWHAGGDMGSGELYGKPRRGQGHIWGAPTQQVAPQVNCTVETGGAAGSIGVLADGTVIGWGANQWMEPAVGDTNGNSFYDIGVPSVGLPAGYSVKSIAGWEEVVAVVLDDGTLWVAGINSGDGAWPRLQIASVNHPGFVQVTNISNVRSVAVEYDSMLAIKEDGTVWAATSHPYIAGLAGTTAPAVGWHQVPGITNAIRVGIGAASYAFALGSDGKVRTWGHDEYMLGRSTGTGTVAQPYIPDVVPGLPFIEIASAQQDCMLAWGPDGTCWGWGGDYGGNLGLGTPSVGSVYYSPVQSPTWPAGKRVAAATQNPWENLTMVATYDDGELLAAGQSQDFDNGFDYGIPGTDLFISGGDNSWTRIFPSLYTGRAVVDVRYHYANGPLVRIGPAALVAPPPPIKGGFSPHMAQIVG